MNRLLGEERLQEISELRRRRETMSLDRQALTRFLRRHEAGDLSAAEIAAIANALEAGDDVEYEVGAESTIADILFELATPEIAGELTADRTTALLHRLVLPLAMRPA